MNEHIEVEVHLRESDLVAYARWQIKHSPQWRTSRDYSLGWGVVFVMTSFLPTIMSGYPITVPNFTVAGSVIVCLIWAHVRGRQQAIKAMVDWLRSPEGQRSVPFVIRIDENRFSWHNQSMSSKVVWAEVRDISVSDDCAYISIRDGGAPLIVPSHAFAASADFKEFVDFSRQQWLRHPGNEQQCPQCHYDLTGATRSGCPECGWRRETANK